MKISEKYKKDFEMNRMIRKAGQKAALTKATGGDKKNAVEWKGSLHKLTI
jgi:hypothetical protein